MSQAELLKIARDQLLSLHKSLVDFERGIYEGINGPTSAGAFLNLLIEDAEFEWLRKFSTLIVDIDEMFAQNDGFADVEVESHLAKMRDLIFMESADDDFADRYQTALQRDFEAAGKHAQLRRLLAREKAA
jgi:hypothetical protein